LLNRQHGAVTHDRLRRREGAALAYGVSSEQ